LHTQAVEQLVYDELIPGGQLKAIQFLKNIMGNSIITPAAIQVAAQNNQTELLNFFLSDSVHFNVNDAAQKTLYYAINAMKVDATELLLNKGALIHPSHMLLAVHKGKTALVTALLNHGGNFSYFQNSVESSSESPICLAAKKNNPQLLKMVLEHGANPCINVNGKPLLQKLIPTRHPNPLQHHYGSFFMLKVLMEHILTDSDEAVTTAFFQPLRDMPGLFVGNAALPTLTLLLQNSQIDTINQAITSEAWIVQTLTYHDDPSFSEQALTLYLEHQAEALNRLNDDALHTILCSFCTRPNRDELLSYALTHAPFHRESLREMRRAIMVTAMTYEDHHASFHRSLTLLETYRVYSGNNTEVISLISPPDLFTKTMKWLFSP